MLPLSQILYTSHRPSHIEFKITVNNVVTALLKGYNGLMNIIRINRKCGKHMIKSENLKFQYKRENHETIALDGLNIEIPKGEFTVIIGHNGSGKSTFAKLANGILLPSGGAICGWYGYKGQ